MSLIIAIAIVTALLALPVAGVAMLLLAGHARHRQRARRNREEVQR